MAFANQSNVILINAQIRVVNWEIQKKQYPGNDDGVAPRPMITRFFPQKLEKLSSPARASHRQHPCTKDKQSASRFGASPASHAATAHQKGWAGGPICGHLQRCTVSALGLVLYMHCFHCSIIFTHYDSTTCTRTVCIGAASSSSRHHSSS